MSRTQPVALFALGLSVLAVWLSQHRYGDITHDAVLYALLGLARMHPQTLSNDVFLRFGSQDHFTVFSPLFGLMIRLFDLAPAAAILTFASQAALCGCAWLVARRFMSPASALLGTGLLLALPGFYGSGHLFSYTEDFLTARLPAEALALASIAAALSGRLRISLASILAATLIHPIIASAGVVMLTLICVVAPRPRLATTVAGSLIVLACLAAVLVHTGPFARFDPQWLNLITEFTRYLFVYNWSLDDWARLATPIAVMLVGCLCATQPVLRTVCACATICACSGIVLTWIWCDLLQAVLPTQMQLWRWVWMPSVLAVVLSPAIATACWNSGSPLQRAALFFIGSSLLLRADSGAPITLMLAVSSGGLARWHPQFRYGQYVLFSAIALLAFALALGIADGLPKGLVPACALLAVWRLGKWLQTSSWKMYALAVATAMVCVAVAPDAVPAQSEVLWLESPVSVWYLLDRPSYWSAPQMAGFVFSRPSAVKLDARLAGIKNALRTSGGSLGPARNPESVNPIRSWVPGNSESMKLAGLPILCADPDLGYLVSRERLGPTDMPPVTPDSRRPDWHYYIYNCRDFRGS
jgi:hypothetical protein